MLRIAAQKRELRSVIGEGVDLAVIQLDRADGLRRRIDRLGFGAKAAEGGLLFVRADPGCDRGRGDGAAGFRLQALGSLAERVAQVIERERLQHQADRVGLVAQSSGARREQALARGAAPELHDLEFFLANAFAGDDAAAAVGARAGRLVRVRRGGRSKRGAGHKREVCRERITGHGFWKMKSRILEGRRRLAGHEYWTVGARTRSRILRGMAAGFEREAGLGFWVGQGSKGEQSCAVSGVGFGTASGCRWSLRLGLSTAGM